MTQLRHCKCGLSNYFDEVLDGIGHRGSSFSDIDAVSHDGKTHRFLVQEFKREGEDRDKAQHWMLDDVARLPKWFKVWVVVAREDNNFDWAECQPGKDLSFRTITRQEYRDRFAAWWANRVYRPKQELIDAVKDMNCELRAEDIRW